MATEPGSGKPDEMSVRPFGWGGPINRRQSLPKGPRTNSRPAGEKFCDPDHQPGRLQNSSPDADLVRSALIPVLRRSATPSLGVETDFPMATALPSSSKLPWSRREEALDECAEFRGCGDVDRWHLVGDARWVKARARRAA
jgi:hypothetical protein